MPKPNFKFEKRQRDLAKKKKQDEKRQRKLERKNNPSDTDLEPAADAETPATPDSVEADAD